jgi:DNA invertase Pin-like site-specific DNA recombinase
VGVAKKSKAKMIGYARVSTEDQDLRLQVDALRNAGCWNIWEEKRSATRGKRPELEKALADLRPGDTLVVWRIDRLARNVRELYSRLDQINSAGAEFKSLMEQFDFTTTMGKFVLGILALVAELEVQMTAQRTSAGMQALKAQGFTLGARPKLAKERAARMVAERKAGKTIAILAEKYGVSTATVNNYVKRANRRRYRK